MNTYDDETIVKLAALQLKIDGEGASTNEVKEFGQSLDGLSSGVDVLGVSVAAKLLEGKVFRLRTVNGHIAERCRSLANYMGASIEEEAFGDNGLIIIIRPPSRH